MNTPPVDFSFVYELSGNDSQYISDVISLFLSSIPEKIVEFGELVREKEDFVSIAEQAHFLKSSSSIIIIREMYADLMRIESLARDKEGIAEIRLLTENLLQNFNEALPMIIAEKEKTNLS